MDLNEKEKEKLKELVGNELSRCHDDYDYYDDSAGWESTQQKEKAIDDIRDLEDLKKKLEK